MTLIGNPQSQIADLLGREMIPLSLLDDYLHCPRRARLTVLKGWWQANAHTNRSWEAEVLVNPPVGNLPELLPAGCGEETSRQESDRILYSTEEQPRRLEEIPGHLGRFPGPRHRVAAE